MIYMAPKKKTTKPRKSASAAVVARRSTFDIDKSSHRRVTASYDNARSTDENENLWKYVDSLSAADANSPTVRKVIRNRARYEVANNSYADGMVDTLSSDTIGPEVQLQLGDSKTAEKVESDFAAWARATNLWAKVRTMRRAKCVDGEVFAMFGTNKLIPNRVKLDVRVIECDMIESWNSSMKSNEIDGIRFDDARNPTDYRLLKNAPGDYRRFINGLAGGWIPAEYMLHYFAVVRPGQVRGVSELLPALATFGELRLFTKAVLNCAARAAEISGVMQTDLLASGDSAELSDPLTMIEAVRNTIVSLPEGWKLSQFKPEQPATTYAMFKREIINEAGRCISMPYNIGAADSSSYNYASGRLDHQTYDLSIAVERAELTADVLDRIYAAWLAEYRIVASVPEAELEALANHEWHFSGRGHVDPKKEADADNSRLNNGTLTRSRYWAKHGADWKRESTQWIDEQITMEVKWNEARVNANLPAAPMPTMDAGQPLPDEPDEPPQTKPGEPK